MCSWGRGLVRNVVPDGTACGGSQDRVVAGDVTTDGAHRRALEATLRDGRRSRTAKGDEQGKTDGY
jgi:hypothetical protein